MQNQIFEPVEVIAFFHNRELNIVKFKWKNDIFHVSKINSKWKIPQGNSFVYHYTVICEAQDIICELSFNLEDFKWELVQYDSLS